MRHGVSVQKVFYRQHVEQIEVEDRHAEDLNSRDDWRKGLLSRGKEAMADAARWEKWESQLVRGSDFVHILREYDRSSFPEYFGGSKRKSAADQHQPPASTGHGKFENHSPCTLLSPRIFPSSPARRWATIPRSQWSPPLRLNPNVTGSRALTNTAGRTATHVLPPAPIFAQPVQPPSTQPTPQDMPFHQPRMKQEPDQPWTPQPLHQPASNPPAVEQRRRARKAEIERRCLELQPPLDRSSLPGMQSFQAAMQIAQPLTDQAWEALRPRLLAEKEDMDYEAHRRAEQRAALQATMPSLADDTFLKPAKEIYDKSYDLAQEPLRKRLAEYADEHVNAVWNGYPRLDLYTSPVFAAKVILHVQQRYNADKAIDALPRPSELSKAEVSGALPLDDPFLSLDNMKWVYEKKIKPHVTDALIFICAGCVGEPSTNLGNPKWMAFEGLIQHYGAKHTDHFSKGNITVYWQTAAWPDEPPFYPLPEDFIKPRPSKNTSYKGHGNVRHTPQPRRGGMFNAPGTQNGHFSNQSGSYANGHHSGAQAHPPQSYGQSNHQHGQHLDPAASNVSEGDMANQLADDLREVWDAFDGISDKELLNCVRLQTALHHAIVRFLNKYGHPPSSDLLTQALADNPVLQPIKVANGLACRWCVGEKASGRDSYYGRIRDATLYNTKSLLLHYKMKHERDIGAAAPLSTTMLELPEMQMLLEVPLAQGMDTTKLRLIAGAFPGAFKHQPVIEDYLLRRSSSGITAPIGAGVASKIMDRLAKKNNESQQGKKKKKGKHGSSGAPGTRDGSQELAPQEPQEHEYDPRKPMTSTEEEDDEAIAAKYDTDIARKKEPARATSAAANTFSLANLDPGTLRALQAFGNHSAQSVQQQTPMHDGGMDRPPSVGRDDHVPAPEAPVPQPTAANGTVQPDIAAILASLTGGAQQQPSTPPQVATPTGTGRGSRDASVSRSGQLNPGIDQLYRSLSTSYNQDRPSTSGYAAYTSLPPQQAPMHYRPFAEPPTPSPRYEMPGSDLQAALERNARHFSQNAAAQPQSTPQQQHQQAYVPSPAYAQASPSQHVAPPRYNYIYEDQQHYGQQQGQGQPAPVQYVQRPPQQQHQQLSMGYSVPQQRTVYVDEHGREVQLIPIDAGQQQYAQVPQQVQYGGYGGYHEQQSPPGHGQGYYGGGGQYGGGR